MKKQNIKKGIINLILIMIVIIGILIISIIILNKKSSEGINIDEIESIGSIEKDVNTEIQIIPENMEEYIILYAGEIKDSEVLRRIQVFCLNFMKKIYNSGIIEKTDKEIESYYEENKEVILTYMGVKEQKAFKNVVKQLQNFEDSSLIYIENEFEMDTIKREDDGITFVMKVKYENEDYCYYNVYVNNEDTGYEGIQIIPII